MKETYFLPVTLDNEIAGDEYYEVGIQVMKRKCGDMFFSQIISCDTEKLLTIKEINDYYGTDSNV